MVAEEEVDVGAVREEDGGVGGGPGVESGEGLHLGDGLGVAGDRLGVVLPAHPDELVALLLVLARRCLLDCGDADLAGIAAIKEAAAMPARSACSLSVRGSAPCSISSAMAGELSFLRAAALFASPFAPPPFRRLLDSS